MKIVLIFGVLGLDLFIVSQIWRALTGASTTCSTLCLVVVGVLSLGTSALLFQD